ncbi:hypothetical protein R3P38DRAFT_3182697 [Favolaschia claudopus]|uniref:NAD(P)-binding protein n=1 Tax=Favolaschia claudopus TaxID=2862362 RepID=A0AAW0CJY2_9AGAR
MASLPEFSFSSTGDEVAAALAEEIKGKNVLITGTSMGGIGFETARVLAKYARLVIITGHNAERLQLSENAIKKESPTANIRTVLLDLASLASIRKAAAELSELDGLHVLIHNAAAPIGPFKLTRDNLESQAATDHIGPFLLTSLLSQKLLSTSTSTSTSTNSASASNKFIPRVVWVSSSAHATIPAFELNQVLHLGMGMGKEGEERYDAMKVYANVKAANVLMAAEVGRRGGGEGEGEGEGEGV